MNRLSDHEELTAWNERFASFNDAVLKKWAVEFTSTTPVLEAVIEAQDRTSPSGWSLVTIRLSGVSSLRFCDEPKASYQVLSNGLHTLLDTGRVALEFGDLIDAPESFSELMASPCHVLAETLEWAAQSQRGQPLNIEKS
jgi:hypothetical protein